MRIAIVGGGNMARAIIGGLVAKGIRAADILVVEIDAPARLRLVAEFGVTTLEAAGPMLVHADVLLLAVKPQNMREAAEAAAPHLAQPLVISVAAGIRLGDLGRWLGGRARLVRAMPNTPALVQAGIAGLYAPPAVDQDARSQAEAVLRAVGRVVWVADETQLDAVTAVSGSGPAYVFYFLEALEAAAIDLGLPADVGRRLALATFEGSVKLALQSGEPPATLRANVTSKGGTTARAIHVLDEAHVSDAVVAAVKGAAARARELGDEFGEG